MLSVKIKTVGCFCIMMLALVVGGLKAQDLEDGSRFVFEKDWTPWKKALLRPDTVKKLWVDVDDPFDMARLAEFKQLKGLILTEHPLEDLKWVAQFPNLRILDLQGNGLKTLEGIDALRMLEEFSCASNFIQDLSLLDTLRSLKILKLYNNEVQDLAGIARLDQIEVLDLSLNPITDLSPIAHWNKLRSFSIYKCPVITDISPVYAWTQLKELNISFLELSDFSLRYLKNHTNLVGLRVQGMVKSNEELNYLMGMQALEQLTMGKNDSVGVIDSLYVLKNLRYLDIHSNNVKDISVLRELPRMVKAVVYRNQITDLSPALSCPEMRALFIHENPIRDYSPIFQMGYLQYLNLSGKDFTPEQRSQLKKALPGVDVGFM